MIFAIKASVLGKGNKRYLGSSLPSPPAHLNGGDTWLSVNPHLPKTLYVCKCTRVSAFQDDRANFL